MLSKNNPDSARRFSPGWGIEVRGDRLSRLTIHDWPSLPEANHGRRCRTAKSLFLAASDLAEPAERAAFLERECGGDAELRARVEALLRANDAAPLPAHPRRSLTLRTARAETKDYA